MPDAATPSGSGHDRQRLAMKILAVDDNRTNLHILQVFLRKQGHEVITAENGEEAVRLFGLEMPDAVLLDIMMPVMNGFEAARRIKAMVSDRWVPVMFLSALNRDENLVEGLAAGADDYLTKPINFVVLEAKLRSMQRSLALQAQAREALRRLETVSDNVLEAIVTLDASGRILTVNRASSMIFGWPAEKLVGEDFAVLLAEGTETVLDWQESQGQQRELIACHRDGHHFPIRLGVSQMDLDGQRMYIGVARDITEVKQTEARLQEGARQLQHYYEQTQNERQLALRLMEKQLHRPGLRDPSLHYRVLPAESFSGDAVAAARSADGQRLYAMLADATGHGLNAAICVLPMLAVFYRMTANDSSLNEIVRELNQQLQESMPSGRFVAATLLCLDQATQRGEIWVGGTPEACIFDSTGRCLQSFVSDNLPLGILGNGHAPEPARHFQLAPETQILLYSDGVVEATNPAGQAFGRDGLLAAIEGSSRKERFTRIENTLLDHLNGLAALDDVSFMLIDCN